MAVMNLPAGWRANVPVVQIPRHPLWMDAYQGAWDLFAQWAAQPDSPDQPEAAAILHYARYAFAALPLHAWLDRQYDAHLSPLNAWSEWSLYQITGDMARLNRVLPVMVEQYQRLRTTRRRANSRNEGLGDGATAGQADRLYYRAEGEGEPEPSARAPYGWVDLSAQQAMAAEFIASIARVVGAGSEAETYEAEQRELCSLIEQHCWNDSIQFYADCGSDGMPQPVKTAAGLWPLLAGVPSPERARRIAAHLGVPGEFWRVHVFPGLSADHPRYSDRGDGRRGAVWPFQNYAIIKGLERYGLHDLARRAADNHLTTVSHVYKETLSHWDHYAPDYIEPGSTARHAAAGTGISAVALLLETILGLRPDAPAQTLHWRPGLHETYRVEGLRVGSSVVSLHVTSEAGPPGRLQAVLRVSQPLCLHVTSPEGVQWVDVEDEIALSVANQATSP